VKHYISTWRARGYGQDIPDEVPDELMREGLAPSYKAIAIALLSNDLLLSSLGYSTPHSKWYDALKRIEIDARNETDQLKLFR